MKFLLIKNNDTEKLGGMILRDNSGRLYFTAINSWLLGTLDLLLTPSKFTFETRIDNRTIRKVEISKKDEKILDVIKTKLLPPYTAYAMGRPIQGEKPAPAKMWLDIVWKQFSKDEHQEIREV